MSEVISISNSELRHTYPYGARDRVMAFSDADDIRKTVESVFAGDPKCRRIVVPVEQGDVTQVEQCETAGLRYVLDVRTREGDELSLMVAEPEWVSNQSTDTKDLKLQ